jgi:hypothetical protein
MSPIGGETLGCRLLSSNPTVMVELQFASRDGAENVIATFNNQKVSRLACILLGWTNQNNRLMEDYSTSTCRMFLRAPT